jgi:hypothetical protein
MEKGDRGIMTWKDDTTSKVFISEVKTYPSSGMPNDYFFEYDENETHRPLKHPTFGEKFPLPEAIAEMVFKKD